MGQVRINLVTNVLNAAVDQEEAIISEYAAIRQKKMQAYQQMMNGRMSGNIFTDEWVTVEDSALRSYVKSQINVGRAIRAGEGCVDDRSVAGAAKTSEDFCKISLLSEKAKHWLKLKSRPASELRKIVNYLAGNTEAVNKRFVVKLLNDVFAETPRETRLKLIAWPIANLLRDMQGAMQNPIDVIEKHFKGQGDELYEALKARNEVWEQAMKKSEQGDRDEEFRLVEEEME
jgi:hypothetical protein